MKYATNEKRSVEECSDLVRQSSELQDTFEYLINECCAKSEMYQCLQLFHIIKYAIASD